MRFTFDGTSFDAHPGESLAAALLRAGCAGFRSTPDAAAMRGPVCGMGVCFDCRVAVTRPKGGPEMMLRACVTKASEGMVLRSVAFPGEDRDG